MDSNKLPETHRLWPNPVVLPEFADSAFSHPLAGDGGADAGADQAAVRHQPPVARLHAAVMAR